MSKADVAEAFRNVRVDEEKAYNFCYAVGDLVVITFSIDVPVVGVTGFLGRHVGRGRTRALQHHAQYDPSCYTKENK